MVPQRVTHERYHLPLEIINILGPRLPYGLYVYPNRSLLPPSGLLMDDVRKSFILFTPPQSIYFVKTE